MYTLTRKLVMVCLAVVLSVLAYGCGGGSSKQASMSDVITDVGTAMVTTGLTPDSGTYPIQPGGTANAGDVDFSCPADGPACEVTVDDEGSATSAGGMATAMDSDSARLRLAEEARDAAQALLVIAEQERDDANLEVERLTQEVTDAEGDTTAAQEALALAQAERDDANLEVARLANELRLANLRLNASDVDLDELADNFTTIPEGVYTIQQGQNMDVGDANFSCPADAADPCEVNVDEDGNVTSAGGMATAQNSVAAMNTMTAIALSDEIGMLEVDLAPTVGVSRSPSGVTTIALTHVATRIIRRSNIQVMRLTQVTKLPNGWVRH